MPYLPDSYYPAGYWPTGYFPAPTTGPVPPSSAQKTLDVRLYSADGTRKFLPQGWISTVEFEHGERGGYQNGTMQLLVPWEQLQLVGTEYVDIWLWGQRLYRGYVRTPQNEIAIPERSSPTLYGLMELLNGYLVRRCLCYAEPVDISQVFLDLAAEYVQKANRLPGIMLDAAGVPALGITLQEFCAQGKSVSQALNQLCDLAPQQVIWGCDLDASGNNRLYLRARAETVGYKFAVGEKIKALVYPRDATSVVNRVYVTGGQADPPNLAPNASFEECVAPSESATNLLLNASFEEHNPAKGSSEFALAWQREYRASRKVYPDTEAQNRARTGTCWMELDNYNDGAPEAVVQSVSIGFPQPVNASVWARQETVGEAQRFRIQLYLLSAAIPFDHDADIASYALASYDSPDFTPPDTLYTHYQVSWTPPVLAAGTVVAMRLMLTSAGGADAGLLCDDAALWLAGVQSKGWRIGSSQNAAFSQLDWQNADSGITPVDGAVMVKAQANPFGVGDYTEIATTAEERPEGKPGRIYYVAARFRAVSGTAQVAVGLREYADSSVVATTVSAQTGIVSGLWQIVTLSVTTNGSTNGLEPLIRLYNTTAVYIDAVGLYEGSLPPVYYPGETFEAQRAVTDYTSGEIGAEAAASITTWGDREKEESVESVVDESMLDAYCQGYFRAHATPNVQAKLELFGAEGPVLLDGQVEIVNLPSPPPALFPSRVRYQVGESVNVTVELNNERPDLALLLRAVQERRA